MPDQCRIRLMDKDWYSLEVQAISPVGPVGRGIDIANDTNTPSDASYFFDPVSAVVIPSPT
jgi:hypothetical protein